MHERRGFFRAAAFVAFLLFTVLSLGAGAQEATILHEFIPPDPNEDVSFAATTLEGDLPAAIQTPSGVATAPDPRKPPTEKHTYAGATTEDSPDATYEPDRDTRRPKVESYDDPFSPATAPFKRLRAYDMVNPDYSLGVRDKTLKPLKIGGSISSGDEPFYGDISVDLLPEEAVRVPTVGPGARVLRMHANPEVPVTLVHDGADNWFVRSSARERIRLVVELAIPRSTFGSEFADVDWSELAPLVPKQPVAHEAAFNEVAQAVGVSHAMRPRDAVRRLVAYFRAFAPSDEIPSGRGDIYLDLALSKKGVCRHRSFAFLVTALHLGIPARMVVNEAHAWVEVYDGTIWHRVDLGGAAANLDENQDEQKPAYVPPPDPYAWPALHDSGQDLADRTKASANAQNPNGNGANGTDNSTPTNAGDAGAMNAPDPSSTNGQSTSEEASDVSVEAAPGDARRGVPFHVQGRVTSAGSACAHLRVDVALVSPSMPNGAAIGSLSTDENGNYDGSVVVPRDFTVGDYDLVVETPGDERCGAGRSK